MGARQSRRSDSPGRTRDRSEPMFDCNKRNDKDTYSQQSFARALKITFAVMTSLTVLLFLMALIIMTVVGNGQEEGGGGGDGNANGPSLVFAMIWMLLMAVALLIVGWFAIWKSSSTMTPRFRVGLLGGSLLMYANMALVCAVCFWNIVPGENRQDRNLQEEEGGGSLVFAIASLLLAVAYTILAALILNQGKAMSEDDTSTMEWNDDVDVRDIENLSVVWIVLCSISLVGLVVALVIAIFPLLGEDAERAQEEGSLWGLLAAILYLMIILGIFFKLGADVFGNRRTATQVMIGVFSGGLLFFAALCCLLAVFHGSFRREDRQREGGLGSMVFSILCILLMLIHGIFACFVIYGSQAIIDANAKDRVSRPFFSFA